MRVRFKNIKIILISLIIFLITNLTFASEIQDYLDELAFIGLQIQAVDIDMYLYLGWLPEEKELMKEASKKAIADLSEIRTYLLNLNLPEELAILKDINLKTIDRLKEIYTGIEEKKDEEIKQAFTSVNEFYSQYTEKLKGVLNKYKSRDKLPENFNPINEEIKLIKDQKDKDIYLNAIKLIKDKKYKQAYKNLNDLLDKYKGTFFEDCLMLRISDCLLMVDSDIRKDMFKASEEGIKILSEIVDKNKYSPVLYEAFYKWRTKTQEFYHGMSNMSEIPNKEYNQKRWQIVQTIKKYLVDNPNDLWAKTQIDLLLSLPNIQRGGPMGNDNLIHYGILFGGMEPKEAE